MIALMIAMMVAGAEDEAPPYDEVRVRIRSDKPLFVEEILSSENRFNFDFYRSSITHFERARKFCIAPCERIVTVAEAAYEHRISAQGVSEGQDFAFSGVGPAALVTIKTGNARKNSGGKGLLIAGCIFTGISAVATVIGAVVPDLRDTVMIAGGFGIAVGIGGIVSGLLLYLNNRTVISVEPDPDYQPPRDDLSPPPLPGPAQTLTAK